MNERVNHPKHYASHPSGVECIDIAELLSFNLGNALKYLWRAGLKEPTAEREDHEKALWYLRRESELFNHSNHKPVSKSARHVVIAFAVKVRRTFPERDESATVPPFDTLIVALSELEHGDDFDLVVESTIAALEESLEPCES